MPTLSYKTNLMLMNWLRGASTPPPSALYLGALTREPSPDGSNVFELVGGNYARRELVLTPPTQAGGITSASNQSAIVFPTASVDWQTITHLAVFSDTGDLLIYGPLAAPRGVQSADALAFAEGTVQLRLR
jgi:hypothetical protein